MSRLLCVLVSCFVLLTACAQEKRWYPEAVGFINDFDGLFSAGERASLDSLVRAFEKETTAEIVVVTVDTSFSSYDKFDSTVIALHNAWGAGKKGKDNGVLIAVCKAYRRLRISNGYGIEAKMTNEETKRIIDEMVIPEFRDERFYEGTRNAILAIMKKIR